jgi:hypothetical protein
MLFGFGGDKSARTQSLKRYAAFFDDRAKQQQTVIKLNYGRL